MIQGFAARTGMSTMAGQAKARTRFFTAIVLSECHRVVAKTQPLEQTSLCLEQPHSYRKNARTEKKGRANTQLQRIIWRNPARNGLGSLEAIRPRLWPDHKSHLYQISLSLSLSHTHTRPRSLRHIQTYSTTGVFHTLRSYVISSW